MKEAAKKLRVDEDGNKMETGGADASQEQKEEWIRTEEEKEETAVKSFSSQKNSYEFFFINHMVTASLHASKKETSEQQEIITYIKEKLGLPMS